MVNILPFYPHDIPGLVNIQKTMENHHAINGKINYFDWPFSSSQTVSLPEDSPIDW